MGRIINPDGVRKERTRLSRSVVLALRELTGKTEVDNQTRDLAAYIVLALQLISSNIDKTVEPWEKRGYWIKADRFRMEWLWTDQLRTVLYDALRDEDWQEVALTAARISEKLSTVKVPTRHKLGKPWVGAWNQLMNENLQQN